MALVLSPQNRKTRCSLTCCFVLGLSRSLSPLTSTTTQGLVDIIFVSQRRNIIPENGDMAENS